MLCTSKKFIKSYIVISFIIFILFLVFCIKLKKQKPEEYKVQFAYPINSINPTIYDDWESTFIGNHILYRLLPETNKPEIPFITTKISLQCIQTSKGSISANCKIIQLSFKPTVFHDCLNRKYTFDDIKNEFESILTQTGTIIPNWKSCTKDKETICVVGDYLPDLSRRLRTVNLRFGWIKSNMQDSVFGAGPYCLYGKFDHDGNMYSGSLKPISAINSLKKIVFYTSQNPKNDFHLAIYGNKELLNQNRKNISVHTPLAYYVITNPKLEKFNLPWNTIPSRNIINKHLTENEVFFPEIPNFFKFAPQGLALSLNRHEKYPGSLAFAIPNYLTGCKELADKLNNSWKVSHTKAYCTDIVSYVYDNIVKEKSTWHAFLVGLSASDPSRDSIRNQYFSTFVSSSWLRNSKNPDQSFYLVGIGQTLATVDGKKICSIKPNPLGLSDIFVTDLLSCGN